jgi:glucose/mannose-6-phosphate isomerase
MFEKAVIQKLDSQHMRSSIEVLQKQCSEAWEATKHIAFPEAYKNVDRIVLFGMGGSALGMHMVKTIFSKELHIPIEIVNDYDIPAQVNKNTLAILSSYSGTTEETVHVAKTILDHTPHVFVVSTGGALQEFASTHGLPAYIFTPQFNPSNQPRMAVGYSVMAIVGACARLEIITVTGEEVAELVAAMESWHAVYGIDVPEERNPAKQLARACVGTLPVFISSEFLEGATHAFTNQVNENGKQFAIRFPIPEMNHHLIEGFVFPPEIISKLLFVFITSTLYHPRNQKRYVVSEEIATQNGIATTHVALTSTTPLHQAMELLLLGSYTSFYLAIANGIDPSPIPNVTHLKKALE